VKVIREVAAELGLEYYPGKAAVEIMHMLDSLRMADALGTAPPDPATIKDDSRRLSSVMGMIPGVEVDLGAAAGYWNERRVLMGPDFQEHEPMVAVLFEPPFELGLRVYREGFLSRMGKLLGFQDVQLGHPELDRLVMVKAADENAVRRLLGTPSAQTALLTLFEGWPTAVVNDVAVRAAGGKDREDVLALLMALRRVADALAAGR